MQGKAQVETVLYSFAGPANGGSGADAAQPYAGLVRDSSGNLFGTTQFGGNYGRGTVFELVNSSGSYTERVLYNFRGGTDDGADPMGSLVLDSAGNLYGTTETGGASSIPGTGSGAGTVFELVNSSGTYTEQILHKFTGSPDGVFPLAGLVMDSSGNLYGTTQVGGSIITNGYTFGTVFELVNSSGSYTEKVLYNFGATSNDGSQPFAGLVMDAAGNLYGTTKYGGGSTTCINVGCGTVFELVNSSGSYTETILHVFGSTVADGAYPIGGLMMDAAGDLYGTTVGGVSLSCYASGCGTVFEMVNSSGSYAENVLYRFVGPGTGGGIGADGAGPFAGLLMDASGNLYGTTANGGAFGGWGTVFELVNSSGSYTEKVLYSFTGTYGDGLYPYADLTMDPTGDIYGTTAMGGASGFGTVFEINPNATAPAVRLSTSSLTLSAVIGVPSAPQTIKVTNSGSAILIFGTGAVTLSGTNSADFALSADSCSNATVAYVGTCSVSVTFTPSFVGSENATLSFSDNTATSPQTVMLNGTGFSSAAVSLSPGNLDFGVLVTGATSAPEIVTLANTGTGALGNISISTQGNNFSETNNCGTSVAQGANCEISVTYKAAAAGGSMGTILIADDAATSPQKVTLQGDSGDFSISAAPGSSSVTISRGQTANYLLSVASEGALAGTVNLTCAGAPSQATCNVNPSSIVMTGGSATTVTVTLTTTASSYLAPGRPSLPPPSRWPIGLWAALVGLAITCSVHRKTAPWVGFGGLQAGFRSPRDRGVPEVQLSRAVSASTFPLMAAIMLGLALSASCGGGGSSTVQNSGTPTGTYNLTVTGTLTSGSATLTHNLTIILTVN
ncbi:MAG: choice-of-anchor tandem repeat GloVer-containing protein [Terriglobia bacterium]